LYMKQVVGILGYPTKIGPDQCGRLILTCYKIILFSIKSFRALLNAKF
jgi:hypothetical protein